MAFSKPGPIATIASRITWMEGSSRKNQEHLQAHPYVTAGPPACVCGNYSSLLRNIHVGYTIVPIVSHSKCSSMKKKHIMMARFGTGSKSSIAPRDVFPCIVFTHDARRFGAGSPKTHLLRCNILFQMFPARRHTLSPGEVVSTLALLKDAMVFPTVGT